MREIDSLPAGLIRRSGDSIIAAIEASNRDQDNYSPPLPPDESHKALLRSMQKLVASCAGDLGLAAETVASKRDLVALVFAGDGESKVLAGWRRAVIGGELLALLERR